MRISVAASHVEPIDMRLHGGWGSVAAPPLASDAAQDDGETLCCAVSGAAADGSGDVIALVDSAEPSPSVEARRALCFSKPRSLSHVAAAQLPILVLTAAAALHSVGLSRPGTPSISMRRGPGDVIALVESAGPSSLDQIA